MKKVAATQSGRWKGAEYKKFEIPARKRERLIQAPAFSACIDRAILREAKRRCGNVGTCASGTAPILTVDGVEFRVDREQLGQAREEIARKMHEWGMGVPRQTMKAVKL